MQRYNLIWIICVYQRIHLIRDVFQDYNRNENNGGQKNNEHKNQEKQIIQDGGDQLPGQLRLFFLIFRLDFVWWRHDRRFGEFGNGGLFNCFRSIGFEIAAGTFPAKYFHEKRDKSSGPLWNGFLDWCVENVDDDDDKQNGYGPHPQDGGQVYRWK